MKKIVTVKNVNFGEGMPKVCIPLIGKDDQALLEEVKAVSHLGADVIEWRIDYHIDADQPEKMKRTAAMLQEVLEDLPLLVTFRSKKEGGEKEISTAQYIELNKELIASSHIDLVDIELFTGEEAVSELVSFAHSHGVKVVMSNHDFNKTPSKEEIIKRLCAMQSLGADMPKIAVMPNSYGDVLTLLAATYEMNEKYGDRPIITMSMSGKGVISRMAGEIFGSALTFGAAQAASAPGQIPVKQLATVLEIIHNSKG